MLSKSQSEQIKKQILEQIEKSNLPEKEKLKKEVSKMNEKELEEFLKEQKQTQNEKCIFCSIIDKEIPSYEIEENKEALAVLEINPVSLGHIIIIPKLHSQETSKKTIELSKKIADSLKILKPKNIDVVPSSMFGHEILNVLPIYTNETIKSPRRKASEKDLKLLQEKIKKALNKQKENPIEPKEQKKEKEIISDKTHWLPRRIP